MVSMHTQNADALTKVLLFIAPMLGLITERTIHLALTKTNGKPQYKLDKLNRFTYNDITILMATLLTSGLVVWLALRVDGPQYVIEYLAAARHEVATLGWALTILWWVHVSAPFIVGIALTIGRRKRRTECGDVWKYMKEQGFFMG